MKSAALLLGLIFSSSLCLAQKIQAPSTNGLALLRQCHLAKSFIEGGGSTESAPEAMYCLGVINGAFDALQLSTLGAPKMLCLPKSITTAQLTLVVIKFVDEHPEALNMSDGTLATIAIVASYPCTAP